MHSLIRKGCPVFDRTPFFARGPVVPFAVGPEPELMHVRCVPFPFPRRSPSARDLSPVARSEVCYFYRRPPSSHAPAVASPIAFPCRRLRSPLPRRRFIARSVARPVVAPRRTLCRLGSLPVPPSASPVILHPAVGIRRGVHRPRITRPARPSHTAPDRTTLRPQVRSGPYAGSRFRRSPQPPPARRTTRTNRHLEARNRSPMGFRAIDPPHGSRQLHGIHFADIDVPLFHF